MDYEKVSFVEAVQELAKQLGIEIEYESTPGDEKQSEQELFYDINTEAAKYFYNNLQNSEEGEVARKYLKERKIKPQTITSFGLGYALRGWEHFLNFAKEKKLDINRVSELGLIGKSDETPAGRYYDKFSGRLIFPIFSPNGRVVAFAGRILDEREKAAKYLNSPESSIYIKGRILYGLSFAKDEIRKLDKAILVEGYMDLISLHQSGIKNVVAVSGTALTEEQVQLLSRYTKNVVLLFDADTAGIKASMRSIELLLKKDIEVKIAALPSGEDPDSFINNYGKEKFEEIIAYAQNFLEYQSGYYEKQGMFSDPARMTEAVRELVKQLSLIQDEIKRKFLIQDISKKFSLREILIEKELDKYLNAKERTIKSSLKTKVNSLNDISRKVSIDSEIPEHLFFMEENLIKLLLKGNKNIHEIIIDQIKEDDYLNSTHKKIATIIYNSYQHENNNNISDYLTLIDDGIIQNYIRELLLEKYAFSRKFDEQYPSVSQNEILLREALDTINKFQLEKILIEIKKNHDFLENANSKEEEESLLNIINDLNEERSILLRNRISNNASIN
jgi:DNA primase